MVLKSTSKLERRQYTHKILKKKKKIIEIWHNWFCNSLFAVSDHIFDVEVWTWQINLRQNCNSKKCVRHLVFHKFPVQSFNTEVVEQMLRVSDLRTVKVNYSNGLTVWKDRHNIINREKKVGNTTQEEFLKIYKDDFIIKNCNGK